MTIRIIGRFNLRLLSAQITIATILIAPLLMGCGSRSTGPVEQTDNGNQKPPESLSTADSTPETGSSQPRVVALSDTHPTDISQIDRTIRREPAYETKPGYCLFAFGPEARTKIWIVSDGNTLHVDRNANLDLTEDGEAFQVAKSQNRTDYQDADFPPVKITSEDGSVDCEVQIGFYKVGKEPKNETVKITVDGTVQQYAGWQPIFSNSPETAKVYHFGGKYTPCPLRIKELSLSAKDPEVHVAFRVKGVGEKSDTRLSITAVPKDVTPIAEITWPSSDSITPLTSTAELVHRC